MYRTNHNSWTKHWDFILLDALMIEFSYLLIYSIRRDNLAAYGTMYLEEGLLLLFSDLTVVFFTEPYKNILRRSRHREFKNVCQHILLVYLVDVICLYFLQRAQPYSRILIGLSAVTAVIFCTVTRLLRKARIKRHAGNGNVERSVIIVTTSDRVEKALHNVMEKTFHVYTIPAVFLLDENVRRRQRINTIPLFGRNDDLIRFVCHRWCDAVYIDAAQGYFLPETIASALMDMGITIHMVLDREAGDYVIENFGDERVLTSSLRMVSTRTMFAKRCIDILGGTVGCVLTGILYIFIAPQIYHASPGPVFFAQTRIGRNGRKFKMYKFRSMYLDAEERKKELLDRNKSKDGFIFKIDDDPRIIGSERKDRNGRPNGIGNKIRRTSMDEFPQFWNVLKGDMSLVGTRPPTVDEWEKYSKEQRLRMSIKPGITGIWQISGRSDITDFDEILRMDTEYIRKMSLWEDFKILLQTVKVVFLHKGAE
jgi:exopolysaccharide biosynthesis polyprenyl glycosylphosphotransferase